MKRFKLFLLLALLPLAVAAVYMFKTPGARGGLVSSQVNCILKDSRGYVWMATPAGLYRYDGYVFRSFQSNSQDGSSLPDSYVYSVQEALDGTLWVRTATGISVYHPQTETFENDLRQTYATMGLPAKPEGVFIDKHKNMWFGVPGRGVIAFDMQKQLSYEFSYTDDKKGIPQGHICSIGECRDGAVAAYDNGTIVCMTIAGGRQRVVWKNNELAQKHIRNTATLRIYADKYGRIWLYGQGTLMAYDPKKATWDGSTGNMLGMTGQQADRAINCMAGDKDGNIWLATEGGGLIRMDAATRKMERVPLRTSNDDGQRMQMQSIKSVYVDDTDLLWVGTEKSGVAFTGKHIYKFGANPCGDITAMTQDGEGRLWVGTSQSGVLDYDGALASLKVSALCYTPDGSVWVGSPQNGLTRIKGGVPYIYSVAKDSLNTIVNDNINALCADKGGNLWIATGGGLQMYNTRMNSFAAYTKENGKLPSNTVTSVAYGQGNTILAGTSEGLVQLNLSSGETTVYNGNSTNLEKFTTTYITQVYEDSRGLVWVGTREGVNILDRTADHVETLTTKDGLCNNCICAICEDASHNIWLTTTNGVARVVVGRNHQASTFNYGLYCYDTTDGLLSGEFNMGSALTTADGSTLFGGLLGINILRRQVEDTAGTLPRVMLTQLFIGDTECLVGHEYDGNVPLPVALNEARNIELSHSQNTFTIKFAAAGYNQSERLMFVYWLEGRDQQWEAGDQMAHGVTFTDLPSGTYTLHVKATGPGGAVSGQERTIKITVDSPWWMSWWMIGFYALVLALLAWLWVKGFRSMAYMWSKRKLVVRELTTQRDEIKRASDDLRGNMANMANIIGDIAAKAEDSESQEKVSSLHFQLLQIFTRLSEMQQVIEHPEKHAETKADEQLQLRGRADMLLGKAKDDEDVETLTAAIAPKQSDAQTKQYTVVVVDDNPEFVRYLSAHLSAIYNLHTYTDPDAAYADLPLMKADIVVAKHAMKPLSGSELCNRIKLGADAQKTKVVIMTDGELSAQQMQDQGVSVAADDYLAKPFNIQEATMRFNRLLGIATPETPALPGDDSQTRRLESHNASMTTATLSGDSPATDIAAATPPEASLEEETMLAFEHDANFSGFGSASWGGNMASQADRQLMRGVEQYVLQNMSRGQIDMEQMCAALGMGRVPFFHRIRAITKMTPPELVRSLRLRHACTLLTRTNINLSELAINLGFQTAENFSLIFREKFGMPPLEYRRVKSQVNS